MAGSTPAQDRLKELNQAAATWFPKQRRYWEDTVAFLDDLASKRQGAVGLQDANAQGASAILANTINDYLGTPPGPP